MSLAGYADIFQRNIMASGVIPQISAIFGLAPVAQFILLRLPTLLSCRKIPVHVLLRPKVVKLLPETVTSEELGGAGVHTSKSGVAHFVSETEEEGIMLIRSLLSLPATEQPRGVSLEPTTTPLTGLRIRSTKLFPIAPTSPTT